MRSISVISEPIDNQELEFFESKTDKQLKVINFFIMDWRESQPEISIPQTLDLIKNIPQDIDYEIVFLDDGSDSYIVAALEKV